MISPIKMTPAYRYGSQTPWGGDGLRALGKDIPDPRTGESLEVSVLPGLESRAPDGTTLTALLAQGGAAMRGTAVGETFPLLLKLIAAADSLSVQVHPDDAYAGAHEGGKLGKTEAWVILRAEPGAQIVYGIKPGTTGEALVAACEAGGQAVRDCLNFVCVHPGDVFFIPAGMVHALGGGVTLMEIQQSSDVTYRFYDWDRVDAQGKSRELHIKKALDVVDPALHLPPCAGVARDVDGGRIVRYIDEPAFALERWQVRGRMAIPHTPERFRLLTALGEAKLSRPGGEMALHLGDSVFLPAALADCAICGDVDVLVSQPGV